MDPIALRPIGHVRHGVPEADLPRLRAEIVAEIVIDEAYAEAIAGLEGYSHLIVLFWMHRRDPARYRPMVHPRGRKDLSLTGVLSTRGRDRPNPIGLAVVELLGRTGHCLRVRRLDAYDGTPVIDIKPYDPYDVFTDLHVPDWWYRLPHPAGYGFGIGGTPAPRTRVDVGAIRHFPFATPHRVASALNRVMDAGGRGVRRVFCLIALVAFGAAAEPEVRQVFGQWSLRCEQPKRGQERCSIVQDVVTRASGQRVVRAAIGLVPGSPEPIALFTLPLGISLPPGASLRIGSREPVHFPIERCEAEGCRGGLKLGAALVDALKQAQDAELMFHDAQRQPIRVALSLEGFAPALEALR